MNGSYIANSRSRNTLVATNDPFTNEISNGLGDHQRRAAMGFEIIGKIEHETTFVTGSAIRELRRLKRAYGHGRWRKRKGVARVRIADASIHLAELHWYEAAGIGKREFKIKRLLD